ncbi:MAG: hypothetical protein IT370_28645 [Deltaproteobacteria bacterium]|nr:hypothetical protein [Deltaproteobacteria bacterium]
MSEPSSIASQKQSKTVRTPTDPRILDARVQFDRGDFLATRRTLEVLLRANPPEPTRKEAEDLKQRLGTDRVSIGLAIACLILFVVVAFTYLS